MDQVPVLLGELGEGDAELDVVEEATCLLAAAADDELPMTGLRSGPRQVQGSTLPGDHS